MLLHISTIFSLYFISNRLTHLTYITFDFLIHRESVGQNDQWNQIIITRGPHEYVRHAGVTCSRGAGASARTSFSQSVFGSLESHDALRSRAGFTHGMIGNYR